MSRTTTGPLNRLQAPCPIFHPFAFDRVEISGRTLDNKTPICFSILGVCWSEYASGPNLFALAAAAAEVCGVGGWFALKSARPRGFQRLEPEATK